jgi:DNA repair protein RadC
MTDVICDLPWDDRPRERMMKHGAATLSNAELVAILLGSGVTGLNAIQLARELLRDGGVKALARRTPEWFVKFCGVGPAKATRVMAAFEFARRTVAETFEDEPELPVYESLTFGRTLVATYAREMQERAGAAFLDSRNCIIRQKEIFVGTANHALISTKDIIRSAVVDHTCGVVLFHNHPSRSPRPSPQDLDFTLRMRDSLRMVDIELVDHLIVGGNSFVSMKDGGMLEGEA